MQSTTRMCLSFFIQLSLPAILLFLGLTQAGGGEPPQGPRYPSDLALGPGQKYLFTANSGSRSTFGPSSGVQRSTTAPFRAKLRET